MPDLWMDVDVALAEVPINLLPLIDDTDFKSIEDSLVYNQAGLDLVWHFMTTAGAYTQNPLVPTTAGLHDWNDQGNGIYTIEIPSSAGTVNNNTEGFGWFSGVATGVLPWRGPMIGFRAANLNSALINLAGDTPRVGLPLGKQGYNGFSTTVDVVTDQQSMTFVSGPPDDNALLDHVVVFENASGNDVLSRPINMTSWTGGSTAGTWGTDPTFVVVSGDKAHFYPVSPADSTSALVDAILGALLSDYTTAGTLGRVLQTLTTLSARTNANNFDAIFNVDDTAGHDLQMKLMREAIGVSPEANSLFELMQVLHAVRPSSGVMSNFDKDTHTVNVGEFAGDTTSVARISQFFRSFTQGTAQAGSGNTITLAAGASSVANFYKGQWIIIYGNTGEEAARLCVAYDGGTKIATVAPNWATNPDNTSSYLIYPNAGVDLHMINGEGSNAIRLGMSTGQIIPFTVDDASFAPTDVSFECANITEATATHYNTRVVLFVTGALAGQVARISGYTLEGGKGRFVVAQMTEAPANGDTGIII